MISNSKSRTALGLFALAVACVIGWSGCGTPRNKSKAVRPVADPVGYTKVTLRDLNASPQGFVSRKVCFKAYFAGKTNLYQPFLTQLTAADYVNFAVWPAGARLWLAEDMNSSLPFMYVPRDAGGIIDTDPELLLTKLDKFQRFQPIMVYGTVVSDHNKNAWVVAEAFRTVQGGTYTAESISRLKLAAERYEQKLFDLAAKDYAAALNMGVPEDVEAGIRRSIGLSLLAVEDYDGAIRELSAAARLGASDADLLVGLSEAQREKGLFLEAEKSARTAMRGAPTSIQARAQLAMALGGQEKTSAGLDECNDAFKLAPGDADILRAQGVVLSLAGKDKLDAAIEVYKQAVLARATDVRIQRELGQLYLRKGDFAKAKDYFENVVKVSGKGMPREYCRGCCLLGEAYEGLNQPAEAVKQYLLSQKCDENYLPAYLKLGGLYAAGGREKEAIEQYMIVAQRLDPTGAYGFQAWRRAAELYRAKPENMGKAADCYEQASRINGRSYDNWMDLAAARWEQAKPDRNAVATALRRAAGVSPKAHAPRYRLGVVLNEMGDVTGSVAEFEAAKQINPRDVATLLRLGQGYRRLCKDAEAMAQFEAALALDSANLDVKNSLAFALADQGKPDTLLRAEKLAAEAASAKPGEAAYLDTLGWVQVKLNKTKDAVANLEKAANASGDADVLYHLGSAYFADRQFDKAVEKLTTAEVKLRQKRMGCPSCKQLQDAVQKLLAQAKDRKAREAAAAAKAAPPAPKAESKQPEAPKAPAKK